MTFRTPQEAKRYALDQHLNRRAALARSDTMAARDAREAENKRDWALRQWADLTGEPDPSRTGEDGIHDFLTAASKGEAA